MKLCDVVPSAVLQAVDAMPDTFCTTDVSCSDCMQRAHRDFLDDPYYHARIGRYLSKHRDDLALTKISREGESPARWQKTAGRADRAFPATARAMLQAGAAPQDEELPPAYGIGPQYAGDTPFRARMRLHQSWYRAQVLKLPYGIGPEPVSRKQYGNMLTAEDGEAGRNFLTSGIFGVVNRRLEDKTGTVDRFRLLSNMLSSQPMCFNLFGPLVDDLDIATRLIGALLPGEVEEVTDVRIEYAPEPRGEYLDDRTAFDAFVAYRRPDGTQSCLGIETKLADAFGSKAYDKPRYRQVTGRTGSPWLPGSLEELGSKTYNQLWRNHMLVEALCTHPQSRYHQGLSMLVRHPADADCARTVAGYGALLRPDCASFIDVPLDVLLSAWFGAAHTQEERAWLDAFRQRYLDLTASEGASP